MSQEISICSIKHILKDIKLRLIMERYFMFIQKNAAADTSPSMSSTGGVLGEELQGKIEENARLHKQVGTV